MSEFISVIIPVWNGAAFLPGAVSSVMAQGYPDFEIVIVDDGSEDETPQVAATLEGERVRYFRELHRGLPATRNRGLEEARGSWIAFLDVDDSWPQDKLARQAERLGADPALDFVLGLTRRTWKNAEGHLLGGPEELALSMGAALFRREVFEKVGRFDEERRFCDDIDWFQRAREAGLSFRIQRQVVLHYFRHETNLTNDDGVSRHSILVTLKRSLQRRRRSGVMELPDLSSYYDD